MITENELRKALCLQPGTDARAYNRDGIFYPDPFQLIALSSDSASGRGFEVITLDNVFVHVETSNFIERHDIKDLEDNNIDLDKPVICALDVFDYSEDNHSRFEIWGYWKQSTIPSVYTVDWDYFFREVSTDMKFYMITYNSFVEQRRANKLPITLAGTLLATSE